MKTFAEKFVENIEISDIDVSFPYYEGMEANEVLTTSKVKADSKVSINISDTILILNSLKEGGADRVYIEYHCDHHAYIFSGVELKEI